MPSWAQRQFRASPRPRGNDAFDGHRHDLTRAHKLPCETIHLVLVILAARRNEVFPRHGAASHYIHNAEGHAYGQTFPVVQFDDRAFRGPRQLNGFDLHSMVFSPMTICDANGWRTDKAFISITPLL